jgi:peptide/nickel transport system permease protein
MTAQTQSRVAKLDTKSEEIIKSRSHWQRALARLRKDRLTLLAMAIIAFLTISTILAEPISRYILHQDPVAENLSNILAKPSADHVLGTDHKGRDVFSRLLFGGQISLQVGFFAALISIVIAVTLGMITGYYGGIVDDFFNWFVTTLTSIPSLFLLLIIASVLQGGPTTMILVLGLIGWTGIMRLVRGQTLALREREFVIAAKAMGASDWRLMFQHIFPNLVSLVIIALAIDIGGLILTESALSFLGFGISPPDPSWGNMLNNAQEYFTSAPLMVLAPGALITITVLCLYVIGDGVRDALDPTINP